MSPIRVLAAAAAVVLVSAGLAPAQHRAACGTGYVAPTYHAAPASYNYAPYTPAYYAPPVVRRTVVVQQDYFVEPQVSEVVEILDARHAKAAGINYGYYGHNDFYPNKIAVVREVVQRQTIVVPARPDAAGRKVDPIPASPAEPAGQ